MSKSYRDEKPNILAARRLGITLDDTKPLPRIVVRAPRKGDIHPLPARLLRRALQLDVPLEYLYGVSRIELRARENIEIGQPYGQYFVDEKAIILYSMPLSWSWDREYPDTLYTMSQMGAEITKENSSISVSWPIERQLAVWFFIEVLAHELGHHFKNQYKSRQGALGSISHEEYVANLHSGRFSNRMLQREKEDKRVREIA